MTSFSDRYWSQLNTWSPSREQMERSFTPAEVDQLAARRAAPCAPGTGTVAYCVFENPFARAGGIFQVAWNLAGALVDAGKQVVVLSPLHDQLATAPPLEALARRAAFSVPFGAARVPVTLLEPRWEQLAPHHAPPWTRVRWLLMATEGFFSADGGDDGTSPYAYRDESQLLLDSLLACAAVPHALAALGLSRDVVVHAQDWELACCALTVKEALLPGHGGADPVLQSASVLLTSHNPYDRYLPGSKLRLISRRELPGDTIYQRMIPLTDAPLSTVSRTFARELTEDPLQRHTFAGHLQDVLSCQGVVGVDNGPFLHGEAPFSPSELASASAGNLEPILLAKAARRRSMLEVLDCYRPGGKVLGRICGLSGKPAATLSEDVPVFLMFGRLDPGQKGFDVLARAIEALPRGMARFVLTPSEPSGSGDPFLSDLARLASQRDGEVVVFPFRMEAGYRELVAGATYSVWPSLYEPFGGATESYLLGTPLVARSTGGLTQQVVDLEANPREGCGLLYREHALPPEEAGLAWRTLLELRDPRARQRLPLYGAMVSALGVALARAAAIYRYRPDLYGQMLANLPARCEGFTWARAVEEYSLLYGLACGQKG